MLLPVSSRIFLSGAARLQTRSRCQHQLRPRAGGADIFDTCFATSRRALSSTHVYPEVRSSANSTKQGLFQIPGLHQPSDFITIAQHAIRRCRSIRSSIVDDENISGSTLSSQQQLQVLYKLDEISNEVCSVIDAAEFCRCVHVDKGWRDSASQAFAMVGEYITELNTDGGLYHCLDQVSLAVQTSGESFTEEQKRMTQLLKAEFERDGIHLPEEVRAEVALKHQHISQLESLFTYNITSHKKKLFSLPEKDIVGMIPRYLLQQISQDDNLPGMATVSSDDAIVNTILRYSSSPCTRKEAYVQSNTSCPENIDVLQALIYHRHELSLILGFENYAERYLQDKMMENRTRVNQFLKQMSSSIKDGFRKEMNLLSEAKRKCEGESEIKPWDIPYYTHKLKSERHEFQSSELTPYFPISQCFDGMQILCRRLFGIDMHEIPMDDGESWCNENHNVRKVQLVHESEGPLGTIYLDLHPREGKYSHSAHFAIRCGCATNGAECAENGGALKYQYPIVGLVCNLSSPTENGMVLLSHSEMETLFHEFGHALHSLLSRTSFQHLSGTRAAVDFVETPSQLMELFVRDARVLKTFARHFQTGEPISDELISKLAGSRKLFQYVDIQTQLLYAYLDQGLFSTPSGESTISIFAGLHQKMGIPYAEGTFWHSKFGHVVTYGAGYYSYLLDQVFAADIWKTCFASDPLNRAEGNRYRQEVLIHGGAKDPNAMLRKLLGRDPSVESYTSMLGGV